jgi:hypothetical protein
MEYSSKITIFMNLSDKYISVINNIIDYSISKKIVPLKIILGVDFLKKYIINNKVELIKNGVEYLLGHKEDILNFDLKNLDELDNDSEDNISRKNCIDNISQVKKIINEQKYKENEILDIIIEIKNKAKNLNEMDRSIIKGYMEILIMILENIRDLFIKI